MKVVTSCYHFLYSLLEIIYLKKYLDYVEDKVENLKVSF